MATRVLVTLRPDADLEQVVAELTALGAGEVQTPQPELPDVCVATVDEQCHPPDAWAARARRVPGVAEAEVDQLRWSM
jgi:hypothetical protein